MNKSSMKTGRVYYNGVMAGILSKTQNNYRFKYDESYLIKNGSRPVSITLPLRAESYESENLFPVFINILSEGANKHLQCRLLKIDEKDYFSLLLATTKVDSIGPITIQGIDETE